MSHFIILIKGLIPKKIQRPVGRWRIENCNVSMDKKIDLSNEDHCGPCGQYALEKNKITLNKTMCQIKKGSHK
jgi:hypothetical protein